MLLLLKAKFFYKEVEKRLKKNGDITILLMIFFENILLFNRFKGIKNAFFYIFFFINYLNNLVFKKIYLSLLNIK